MQTIRRPIVNKIYESTALPVLFLVLSLITVFIFQNDRHSFQQGHHGFLSSHGMTIAAHLSVEHRFLMVNRMSRDEDGADQYEVYNRFPIGSFAAVRMLTLPFRDNLSMQISVARNLMNFFFIAAACLAYLSLLRLFDNRWVAATATLLAFSSYYCLYYNDMIFNDVPTLFGLLLTFHGMIVFIQDGRFGQLVVKSCAAIFLGWQVYALLLPFFALGCTGDLVASRSLRSLVRSRFFLLGMSALFFGSLVLSMNLLGELLAVGGSVQDLPTVRQILWRFGFADSNSYSEFANALAWPSFITEQFYRMGRLSIPHILIPNTSSYRLFILLGIVVLAVSLIGSAISKKRLLLFSLVVSGLCWALPMRHFVAFHDFQSLFYIGLPLFLYSSICALANRFSRIVGILLCGISALLFVLSSLHLNIVKAYDADTDKNVLTADFQRILEHVEPRQLIFVDGDYDSIGGARHAVGFYLAGRRFVSSADEADFVISEKRINSPYLLTEENRKVFLYTGSEWEIVRETGGPFPPGQTDQDSGE